MYFATFLDSQHQVMAWPWNRG